MKAIKILLLITGVLGMVAMVSCNQKEIMIYEDEPRIYFELPGPGGNGIRDSLVYSFPVTQETEVEQMVRVRLMGKASPSARSISFGVVAEETTALPDNYSLLATIELPANAYAADIPVTIKRAGLLDKSVTLVLEIRENENFKVGFERGHTTKLVWGDMYLKPDNWDSSNYVKCWGEFSQVKYGFILEICGVLELPLSTDLYVLTYYNALVRSALHEYNLNNPPMLDENNAPVTIPTWKGIGGGVG